MKCAPYNSRHCGLDPQSPPFAVIERGISLQKYSIVIQYSENDNCYVASVPEILGCMAHGDTREEAMQEIQTALSLHIEMMQEHGDKMPKPVLYAS